MRVWSPRHRDATRLLVRGRCRLRVRIRVAGGDSVGGPLCEDAPTRHQRQLHVLHERIAERFAARDAVGQRARRGGALEDDVHGLATLVLACLHAEPRDTAAEARHGLVDVTQPDRGVPAVDGHLHCADGLAVTFDGYASDDSDDGELEVRDMAGGYQRIHLLHLEDVGGGVFRCGHYVSLCRQWMEQLKYTIITKELQYV